MAELWFIIMQREGAAVKERETVEISVPPLHLVLCFLPGSPSGKAVPSAAGHGADLSQQQ